MDIKSISASRIKTYDHCKFKYILSYMLYECKDCKETFYTPEIVDGMCPACKSKNIAKPEMTTNWGAVHGTALHAVMEGYALGLKGTDNKEVEIPQAERDRLLDWKGALSKAYKRGIENGQTNPNFAIYDIAKPKDVESGWCDACSKEDDSLCDITGESLSMMKSRGCQGCPKSLYKLSEKLLLKYITRYKPLLESRKILGIEKDFMLDLGQVDIAGRPMISTGYMDLVTEIDDDTIEITDYKFGTWVPSFDEFSEDIQVKMYALAARRTFPQYKEYLITFDYIRKNPLTIGFAADEDQDTHDSLIKKWNEIAAPQTITRTVIDGDGRDPSTSWKCKSLCDAKKCIMEWPKFKEKFKNG